MSNVKLVSSDGYVVDSNGKKVLLDPSCRATCTTPNWTLINKDPEEPLAVDIEFQDFKLKTETKWQNRMARLAIVNTRGETLYDVYVKYDFNADYDVKLPPKFLGIPVSWRDLVVKNDAKMIGEVNENLKQISSLALSSSTQNPADQRCRSSTSVASSVPAWTMTSRRSKMRCGAKTKTGSTSSLYSQTKLCILAATYLESEKFDWHNPVDDARAAMLLYLRVKGYQGRNNFHDTFKNDEADFPPLGTPASKKKR